MTYRKIKVLVETPERTMIGLVHKPEADDVGERIRLSDHLNEYGKQFLNLTQVEVKERGQTHRVGDKHDFVAVSIASISYITPLEGDDQPPSA